MRYSSDAYHKQKVVNSVFLSLEQILTVVAKDKGLSNPKKWVEERLAHCEVHSDYYNYIHLKSHKKMWFGVRDTKFECQPFVLYRELAVTEENMREFEIFTFRTIEDSNFLELIKEAYQTYFDSIKDLRLFYELTPVEFRVKYGDGVLALGEYNDMDMDFDIETDLYCLHIKDSNIYLYGIHREQMELGVMKLRQYFKEVEDGLYTSDVVLVSKMGQPIPFELVKHSEDGSDWSVNWKD